MSREIWNKCLQIIEKNVPKQAFKTWFKPINPIKFKNNTLTIQVPTQFFYEWLEDNYVNVLKEAIKQTIGKKGQLEYSVTIDKKNQVNQPYITNMVQKDNYSKVGQNNGSSQNGFLSPFLLPQIENKYQESNLNLQYTFTSYIEGKCNRLARSAGSTVASNPGVTSFNPLMLYGGVGLGKTHLMQAIGNRIKEVSPKKFVLYVASEKFTTQFIESLKNNKIQQFMNFYLNIDTLLIDDVQFFRGKEKTQEVFFHIFNDLHQKRKQIVMTSDCSTTELKGLQERLLSRFKWGLTTDLQCPDYETRLAIIQKKLQDDNLTIDENVLEYLAYNVDTNIRELEGVIVSLIAHASLNKAEINLKLAQKILKSIVKDIESEVGVEYIQKIVSKYFNVSTEDLKAKTRKKEIVIARQLSMYFTKEYTNYSLKSIGSHFGGRDHSTVIHALQSVNNMMHTDVKFKRSVNELTEKFQMKII